MRLALLLAALSGLVVLTTQDVSAKPRHHQTTQHHRTVHQIPRDVRAHVVPQTEHVPGWCLNGNPYNGSCNYDTLEQCLQDRMGQGGNCSVNPRAPRIEP